MERQLHSQRSWQPAIDYRLNNMVNSSIQKRSALKVVREQKLLTQADLAVRLKISEKTVRNWENYGAVPSFDKAVDLARFFNLSLKELAQMFELDVSGVPD